MTVFSHLKQSVWEMIPHSLRISCFFKLFFYRYDGVFYILSLFQVLIANISYLWQIWLDFACEAWIFVNILPSSFQYGYVVKFLFEVTLVYGWSWAHVIRLSWVCVCVHACMCVCAVCTVCYASCTLWRWGHIVSSHLCNIKSLYSGTSL